MKVPSIIIVVAAALALAVPSGFAATARTAPELGQSAATSGVRVGSPAFVAKTLKALRTQLSILLAKNAALAGKNKKLVAQIRALEAQIVELRAKVPVEPHPLPLPAPVDDCLASGNGCTPDQECTIWGYNCFVAEHPTQAAPLSESSTASGEGSGSTGNLASGEVASAGSSASESATTPMAPYGNMIEENWVW
jgi:hypothetical protein